MRILRIYSLENKGLNQEQCNEIKKQTKVDVLIHMTANNQLQGIQYPVFEFDEIESQTENELRVNISNNDIITACKNSVRSFSERKTSL